MRLEEIAVDVDAMNEGVWVDCRGGWKAKVRSIHNEDARTLADKHLKKNRPIYRQNDLPGWKRRDAQNLELLVECCLVDWQSVEVQNGNGEWSEATFSKDLAYEILSDARYKRMLDDVADAAGMDETFDSAGREADQGN